MGIISEPRRTRSFPEGVASGSLADSAFERSPRATAASKSKRVLDIFGAAAGLVLVAPLVVAVALIVVLDSGWPALYSQPRVGLHGRPFTIWKFRTMVTRAEGGLRIDELLSLEFARKFKLVRDPRVTRVGRMLRVTSFDEVPQLWNVLRGEMSLVGPRPVIEEELRAKYGTAGEVLLSVRPGLTGLWQISGRSTLDYARRVELDLEYIARQSVALDISILLRTPAAVVGMRGAI